MGGPPVYEDGLFEISIDPSSNSLDNTFKPLCYLPDFGKVGGGVERQEQQKLLLLSNLGSPVLALLLWGPALAVVSWQSGIGSPVLAAPSW
jgi:hypothetical protein